MTKCYICGSEAVTTDYLTPDDAAAFNVYRLKPLCDKHRHISAQQHFPFMDE